MDALHLEVSEPVRTFEPLSVVAQPSIFREPSSRIATTIPHGATLLELVLETGMGELRNGTVHLPGKVVCTVDGNVIDREYWHVVRPKPGRLVNIYLVPQGQREAILIGASLAIGVAAIATGGLLLPIAGPVAAGLASAAIAVVGNYALTTLVPLQEENSGVSGPKASNSVTGDSNQLNKDAFVPVVLAESIRVVPQHWARPYTEAHGDDTYWRMLLVFGQGPLQITDPKAGETLLSANPDAYEYEIREGRVSEDPLTLFTQDITEINPASTLGEVFSATPQIQTMAAASTEGSVDITFPQGIFHQGKQNRDPYTVVYTVERSPTGAGTWVDFATGGATVSHTERRETSNFTRRSHRATGLNPGVTYDVRVRRTNGDGGSQNPSAMFWTALRSIQPNDPRPDKTLACIAIRAKKTGSGTVPVISATCGTYALDWNGAAWVEAVTGNPASLGRHLLQGAGVNPNPVDNAAMDLPSWEDFHDFNVSQDFVCNIVFDDEGTILERLTTVLAAGRGRLIPPDTKYAVSVDRNGKTISGMITPRNSSDFKGTHFLRDEVQALRARFINEDTWQVDERMVYADGFDEDNVEDGKIETYDLTKSGITDPDLVWRFGRWRLADMALRLDLYEVTQGIENLIHVPGDLVAFQHHAALLGLTRGRIKSVTLNGSSQVTGCTVDDLITMEVGKTYAARVRLIDDAGVSQFVERAVTTVPGEGYSLTFSTPFNATAGPSVGDLLAFGETNLETVNALIKDIIPGPNQAARIMLVDEAPAVNEADIGEIPEFESFISLPGDFFGLAPAVPVIGGIAVRNVAHPAQPDVVTQQQIVAHLEAISSQLPAATGYELQIKRADAELYQRQLSYPADTVELVVDVIQSDALYDVRVRAVGRSPRGIPNASDWSAVRQIYVPLPQVTSAVVARVAGLELQGQANNTEFTGPDAHFVWRLTATAGAVQVHATADGTLIDFVDPAFAWYEVVVLDPATGYERRKINTTTPQFIYGLSDNREDSRRQAAAIGGLTRPLRRFTVMVTFVDRFGRRGPGQSLTVANPAPEEPEGLIVSGKVLSLFVKADEPEDGDFDGIRVYIGTSSGFDPAAPGTSVAKSTTNFVTIPDQPAGNTRFVRVAMADRFSDLPADLNLSSELAVVIEAPEGPPQFRFDRVVFTPRVATNVVQWTSGTAYVQDGATVTAEAVAAGQATWTTGSLWLYYIRGSGVVQASTNAALAQQPDRAPLAIYRGGVKLTRTTGDIPLANLVTAGPFSNFNIGSSGGWTVGTNDPIITAGNPVVVTASVRAAVLGDSGSTGGHVEMRLVIMRNGSQIASIGVDELTLDSPHPSWALTYAGAMQVIDNVAAGTYTYAARIQTSRTSGQLDASGTAFCFLISAQESYY